MTIYNNIFMLGIGDWLQFTKPKSLNVRCLYRTYILNILKSIRNNLMIICDIQVIICNI